MGQAPRRPAQTGKPEPAAKPAAPQFHVHQPGKTIQQAVANAKQHVANVNKAASKKK
jgi:hypothetical protein